MADMIERVVATLKNFDMVQYDRDEAYERLARAVIADVQARIDALESALREVKAMTPSHYAREHAIIDEALATPEPANR